MRIPRRSRSPAKGGTGSWWTTSVAVGPLPLGPLARPPITARVRRANSLPMCRPFSWRIGRILPPSWRPCARDASTPCSAGRRPASSSTSSRSSSPNARPLKRVTGSCSTPAIGPRSAPRSGPRAGAQLAIEVAAGAERAGRAFAPRRDACHPPVERVCAIPAGASVFYRLEVRGPAGHQILSNPIFVQSAGG